MELVRRHRWALGLMAAGLLCLAGGFGLFSWHDEDTDDAYLAMRQQPTRESREAWIAAEAAASRREESIQAGLVKVGIGLAVASGVVFWLAERRRASEDATARRGRP
jgi:hypothetical protein